MEAYCTPNKKRFAPASAERLRNLTSISRGSARRLRYAAAAAGDRMLGQRLESFAAQRQAHADELIRFALLGDDDAAAHAQAQEVDAASALPTAHERAARVALLSELERSEAAACRAMAVALDRTLPGEVLQGVLSRQLAQTRKNHEIMRDFRDMMIEN